MVNLYQDTINIDPPCIIARMTIEKNIYIYRVSENYIYMACT